MASLGRYYTPSVSTWIKVMAFSTLGLLFKLDAFIILPTIVLTSPMVDGRLTPQSSVAILGGMVGLFECPAFFSDSEGIYPTCRIG